MEKSAENALFYKLFSHLGPIHAGGIRLDKAFSSLPLFAKINANTA